MTVFASDRGAPARATLTAALFIFIYAVVVTYADNYVRVIAAEAGLWQFHATRAVLATGMLVLLAPVMSLRLVPRDRGAVVRRSFVQATAMLIYFGSLAVMSVGAALAGLFTAPIFVLIFSRFLYHRRIGPFRILAVITGFVGTLMVLGVGSRAELTPLALVPVAAGAFYGLSNLATRDWCAGESAATLMLGYFLALGLYGAIGLGVLAIWQPEVPAGAEGFFVRGLVWPGRAFWVWTTIHTAVSVLGVVLMVRAYQMADATRVAVFEYMLLPTGVFWSWAIWGELPGPVTVVGMAMIFAAGALIAVRSGAR